MGFECVLSPEYIGAFANSVTALAASFAAWHAWKSLSSWRDESVGRRKVELAEKVLSSFYQASDVISSIRSPFSRPNVESSDRYRDEDENDEDRRQLDNHYVPIARMNTHREFFGDLFALKYQMKAVFGPEVEEPFATLNAIIQEIRAAAAVQMRWVRRRGEPDQNLQDEWEKIIWEGYVETGEEDEIRARVQTAVDTIEKLCSPILYDEKNGGGK